MSKEVFTKSEAADYFNTKFINVKVQMLPGHTDPIGIAVNDSQLQYWLNTYLQLKGVKLSVNDLLKQYPRPGSK